MSIDKQRKVPVCCDEVKLRHTTHWDWEMASHSELAAAYAQGAKQLRQERRRRAVVMASIVAAVAGLGWAVFG